MNISVFASIWSENLWDELILKNEIELLKEEFSVDTRFKVATYDVRNPLFQIPWVSYFEYFPIALKNPKNILRNMKNFLKFLRVLWWSDRVVIGWGWIIYDSENQSVWDPLNQWIFRTMLARLLRKKIYFYAVWVDVKNSENHKKLQKIFKKAWKVTVRDVKSQKQLKDLGISSEIIDDPVMSEASGKWKILGQHDSTKFSLKDFESYNFSGKKVGLALRSGYIGQSWDKRIEKKLVEELCNYIEKSGWKIIFIPHSIHPSDEKANDYEFMKQFLNYEREIYASLWEVYTVYNHQMIDVMISMRLHSIILSYIYDIDQIALSYSIKTQETLKKLKH